MINAEVLRCQSSRVVPIIFSAVMQSGMPVHDSIASMYMPGIFPFLFFCHCVWIASL